MRNAIRGERSSITLSARQRKLLAEAMSERGSKKEVSERVGCTSQHLCGVISGSKRPSPELLSRLCRVFDWKLDYGTVTIDGVE